MLSAGSRNHLEAAMPCTGWKPEGPNACHAVLAGDSEVQIRAESPNFPIWASVVTP